jgi:signal transduction histidine kinase
MNFTGSKESPVTPGSRQAQAHGTVTADVLASAARPAVLGTADSALAQRLSRELGISAPKQTILMAGTLTQLRELLKTCTPGVIFVDSDLLGGVPLPDAVRRIAAAGPVLVLAPLNAQADLAKLVADESVDFIARVGNFVPLACALITRRLKQAQRPSLDPCRPAEQTASGMGEIFRHEINNPLTGILGNAELVLAHREHFSGVEIQRLQTVVDLAVRLRENIRRISNSWDANRSSKAS